MSRHQHLALLMLAVSHTALCQEIEAQDIVRRSMALLREAWDAAPHYAFVQRDETQSGGRTVSRTHQVVMIDGSDYYLPIANNDEPLGAAERARELQKLKNEKARRDRESAKEREKRAANYLQQRRQNGMFITELPEAFHFTLIREATLPDGHEVWVLAAAPKQRQGPLSREAKVLSGMRGYLWVEKESYRVVRAEASVTEPVSIFGIFARVLPGTRLELATEPVSGAPPMLSRMAVNLVISRLWFRSTQQKITTFSSWRPNEEVMNELTGNASAAEAQDGAR
ncbi:MAG TPA: hypothetical protein VHA14_11295 [Bryobacteraceae bacterium]|nr:hypothetical protein [Bryobacteraceae bacterium]